jgi:hypothetical protein
MYPRGLAVVSVVTIAFALIFAMGSLLASQLTQLAGDLPRYQSTISEKIQSFRETTAGRGTLERASGMLKDLSKELDKPAATAPEGSLSPRAPTPLKPVPVEVRQPDPGALESLQSLISPLLHPLATTGIIVIFVIFILLQREDLRNRLIRLAGSHDLQRTTAALDDAASRLSRLFLIQLLLNGSFGVIIGLGLWLIGVPQRDSVGHSGSRVAFRALHWRGHSRCVSSGTCAGCRSNLDDAALDGRAICRRRARRGPCDRTDGLWAQHRDYPPLPSWRPPRSGPRVWGPIGLVLATPLTVCLVVLGRHVERLEFLDVMFGDRPALSPPEIFYQRMLAGDPTEASEKAEEFLKERSLSSYYDEVALKGLQLAHIDAERGALDPERLAKIRDAVSEFANNISEHEDRPRPKANLTTDAEATSAVETVAEDAPYENLPVLRKEDLPPGWQGEHPVLLRGWPQSPR